LNKSEETAADLPVNKESTNAAVEEHHQNEVPKNGIWATQFVAT